MNILFVLEYYPPHVGGGEVLFSRLAGGLAARGHGVKVLT
ncbi:MAG: glycosyltransferase family 1 protein, partial [Deltaproteobacteria bacterium]|nr:glycosyltransferase family 1 protein [Deltaproteobacteria bacterium]